MPAGEVLRLEADLASLAGIRRHVRERLAGLGADGRCVDDLVGAVDEWVTNVVRHGYAGRGGPVEIVVAAEAGDAVVTVRDAGPPFDPADGPPFDPAVPLGARRLGGMGLHTILALTDDTTHRALAEGGNELTLRRTLRPADGGGDA